MQMNAKDDSQSSHVPVEVAKLAAEIQEVLPAISITLDAGGVILGNWWITLRYGGHYQVVEWRPGRGYGIYEMDEEGYGVGPSVVLADAAEVARRLEESLRTVMPHGELAPL